MPRRIGLICIDTVTALDLTGPAEVFSMANELCANSYELVMVGLAVKPVRTDTGVRVLADVAFEDAPSLGRWRFSAALWHRAESLRRAALLTRVASSMA